MEWDGAQLTVQAKEAPLRPLLEDIAKATGVVVHGDADAKVTVDVRALPLRYALEMVLSSADVGYGFVEFTEVGETTPRLAVSLGKRGTVTPPVTTRAAPRILPEEERMQQRIPAAQPAPEKAPVPAAPEDRRSDMPQIQRQGEPEVTVILDGMPLDPRSVPSATR